MRINKKNMLSRVFSLAPLLFLASCTGESDELKGMLFDDSFASCIEETMDDIGTDDPADIIKIVCQRGVEELDGIEMLGNLEELHIQGNELTDLNALGAIPTLKVLNVSASKTLVTLDGIDGAYNLEVLHANRAPKLRNIAALSELKKLRYVATLMADIDDISSLSHLDNLEEVHLNYNRVSSLVPLANKSKLKWLEAYKNPITDLSGIKNNTAMTLFGIDKTLESLCDEVQEIKSNLSHEARVYGPDNCSG